MEKRTERAALTLTPSESEALELVATTYGMTRSEALRQYTVAEIMRRAATIRGDAA